MLVFSNQEPLSWALLTDLYELTMGYGFWQQGIAEREAVFYLSFRAHPFGGSYTIACGLQHLCEMLCDYRFSASDIDYLQTLKGADGEPLFPESFLKYLRDLEFTCDVDAIEEGTVIFPHEPLVRVQGPLIQAQIVESLILNVINFQTLIATKSARICGAAAPGAVLEFGLRRAQGESGAVVASRAAYIGGCAATSNVLAGKRYGIPVRGTHAHSWVMAFDNELDAFVKYAESMPNNCILLVDTFDTVQGVQNAIKATRALRAAGHKLIGVRLDSGDLASLSRQARMMLDDAGLHDTLIVVSNDLDEYEITALKDRGARIDLWGVGTRLVTAYDQPALGGVYKLSALRDAAGTWQPKFKLSDEPIKTSTPGILQVRRYRVGGQYFADVVYDLLTGLDSPVRIALGSGDLVTLPAEASGADLLIPVFRGGKLVYQPPALDEIRRRAREQVAEFANLSSDTPNAMAYRVGIEAHLFEQKRMVTDQVRGSGR